MTPNRESVDQLIWDLDEAAGDTGLFFDEDELVYLIKGDDLIPNPEFCEIDPDRPWS